MKPLARFSVLLAIFALALVARSVAPWPTVFPGDGSTRIALTDTYYHLRRAELVLSGHLVPPHDLYGSFPHGGRFFWPPLFDYLLAAVTWIASIGGAAGRDVLERVSAFVPPILGSMFVFPTFAVGRAILGERAGLLAAAFAAVVPGHAAYSALGRPDHHCAESLLFASFVLATVALVRRAERPDASVAGAVGAMAGLAVALVSVQMGAVLLLGLVPLYVFLRFATGDAGSAGLARGLRGSGLALAGAAIALALLHLAWGGTRRTALVFDQPSMFQPLLAGLFALFSFALLGLGRLVRRHGLGALPAATLAAAVALVGFLAVPLATIPGLADAVRGSVGFLERTGTALRTVYETHPLLSHEGQPTLVKAWRHTGLFLPLAIGGIVGLAIRWRSKNRPASVDRAALGFVLVASVSLLALALAQLRFVNFFAFALALTAAAAVVGVVRAAPPREADAARAVGGAIRPAAILRGFGAVVAVGGALAANHRWQRTIFEERHLVPEPPVLEALAWLERETPDPGDYLHPSIRPDWGVMNDPFFGHWIVYEGRRPTVANPYWDPIGVRRAARFFLARSEAEAVAVLEEADCRYVFLTGRFFQSVQYRDLLDEDRRRALETDTNLVYETLSCGLFMTAGAMPAVLEAGGRAREVGGFYERFRLVWESDDAASPSLTHPWLPEVALPSVKIFELVEGARITGRGRPGEIVRLEVPATFDSGRMLRARREIRVSEDGDWTIRIPYATAGTAPGTPDARSARATGPAGGEGLATVTVLSADASRVSWTAKLAIPDAAVVEGRVVEARASGG